MGNGSPATQSQPTTQRAVSLGSWPRVKPASAHRPWLPRPCAGLLPGTCPRPWPCLCAGLPPKLRPCAGLLALMAMYLVMPLMLPVRPLLLADMRPHQSESGITW